MKKHGQLALLLFVLFVPFALGISCCCFAEKTEIPPCHAQAAEKSIPQDGCHCPNQITLAAKEEIAAKLFASSFSTVVFALAEPLSEKIDYQPVSHPLDSSPPPPNRLAAAFTASHPAHAPPLA